MKIYIGWSKWISFTSDEYIHDLERIFKTEDSAKKWVSENPSKRYYEERHVE